MKIDVLRLTVGMEGGDNRDVNQLAGWNTPLAVAKAGKSPSTHYRSFSIHNLAPGKA